MKRSKSIKYTIGGVVVLLVAVMFGACGPVNKVIKTGDPEYIYSYGLDKYNAGEWSSAATLFSYVAPYYDGTSRDDSVQFFNARSLYKSADFQSASAALDEFRRKFGRSIFIDDAEGMYTLCSYYLAPGPTRDSGSISSAIMTIDEFLSRYPDSPQREIFEGLKKELVDRLHQKSFGNAYSYYKTGYYKSAIVAFKNALKEYPDSHYREEISYYIVASAFKLADNSVVSKKEDRFLDMIDAYYTFISSYAESEYRDEVEKMLVKANDYLDSRRAARNSAKSESEAEEDKEKRENHNKQQDNGYQKEHP